MKKILLSALAAVIVQSMAAQTFEHGGLNYTVTNAEEWTVTLSGPVDAKITTLDVPATVPYTRQTADNGTETVNCTVTAIGHSAFYNCTSLTSVALPGTVTSIADRAFQNCHALASISFSNSITSIGDYAFDYCDVLEKTDMPAALKTIGKCSFSYCRALKEVNLNEGLESIGASAFDNNDAMLEITFPSTLKTIGGGAFYRCNVLRKVTFLGSVETIENRAFDYSFGIKEVYGTDVESWCRMGFVDPTGNPVNTSHKLFLGGEPVTDLIVPATVEQIGDYAFIGLQGLRTLKLSDGVKKIGRDAFHGATDLESVDLGNTLEHIDYLAFENTVLKELNLPNSVKIIGGRAFENCKKLEKIEWGTGAETVEVGAFAGNAALTTVNISDLSAWCRVQFKENGNPLTNAAHLTLNGEQITDLVIPDGITAILDYAFTGVTGITSVTIPNSVTSIGYRSFWGCPEIESLYIGAGLQQLDLYTFGCSYEIKKLHIADGEEPITIISDDSWANGWAIPKKISDLYIGRDFTVSGTLASNVQLLSFGPKVTNAEANNYTQYASLLMITDLSATPPSVSEFTEAQYANVIIKVPEGASEAYKTADYWKNFALITESPDYNVENINISFNADSYNIYPKGFQGAELAYAITPEVFQPLGVEFTSSDESILTFDGLTPQPQSYGNVTLTARIPATGAEATAEATVYVAPTSVTLTCGETLTLHVGDTYQFEAVTEPSPVVPEMLTWSSGNTNRITVDENGLATALKTGKNVSIRVRTYNSKSYTTYVTIIEPESGIENVEAGDANLRYDVYSLNGMLLLKDTTTAERESLPQGIYILRNGDKTVKFVK